MPENEFEKKVSAELHDLRFRPSEQVWLSVEERIRKKKKRRGFVIIFFVAGLALLGYWQRGYLFGDPQKELFNIEKQKEEFSKPAEKLPDASIVKKDPGSSRSNEVTEERQTDKTTREKKNEVVVREKPANINDQNEVVSQQKIDQPANDIRESKKPIRSKPGKKAKRSGGVLAGSRKTTPVADNAAKEIPVRSTERTNEVKQQEVKRDEVIQPDAVPVETKIDSAKTDLNKQEEKISEIRDTLAVKGPVNDSAATAKIKLTAPRKWKWGLQFTPGISSLSTQNISLGGAKMMDAFAGPNNPGGAPAPAPPTQPSAHKTGFAFQLGGFVQRQLTPRSSLQVGLQYGYYSEKVDVGAKKDTSLRISNFTSAFYYAAAANSATYAASDAGPQHTNSYHFIEATFNYLLRLNKNETKPFTWDVGFTIGQLAATNALVYDTAYGGVYYKNTSQLSKTQFSLTTGFSWTIASGSQYQWKMGPLVNVHMNSLLNNPFEDKKYLFFAGFRTSMIFKK